MIDWSVNPAELLGAGRPERPLHNASRLQGRLQNRIRLVDGCWLWQDARNEHGYGRLRVGNIYWYAHRLAYVLFIGPIPAGAEVHHTCRNRLCCNPRHLGLKDKSGHAVESNRERWRGDAAGQEGLPF